MNRTILSAANICKIFGKGPGAVKAVKDVSVDICGGERVYIYGPSGAGKSTLLHILGGLSRPSGGSVYFKGKNVYDMWDRRVSRIRNGNFGFIFQFYHLLPELNVLENVLLPARIKGRVLAKGVQHKAVGILERVGVGRRMKHRPSQLSGGEAQRVAIARALINSPDILFCDEPTGNLDSERSREIYAVIKEVSEENCMSVVMVSHQIVDKDFFHSEYFMNDGTLEGNRRMTAVNPLPAGSTVA